MVQKKGGRHTDPHYARELERYQNPVPSREYILSQFDAKASAQSFKTLCKQLKCSDDDEVGLSRRLRAMCRDGQLMQNRRGHYQLPKNDHLSTGPIQVNRDGSGYVICDEKAGDVYLDARQMRQVLPGDEVSVRITREDGRGRRSGVIVKVTKRQTTQVVGRLIMADDDSIQLQAHSRDITARLKLLNLAKSNAEIGDYVVVDIVTPPTLQQPAEAEIVEVLGDHLTPGMEIQLSMRARGLPHVWPDEVKKQADVYRDQLQKSDYDNRVDLRHQAFVTIDGADANDFDDAVYCEPRADGGWTLSVAIADVSHYVSMDSPLDVEAQLRGTSVYFPSCVLPMLPEVLSNGLCSLNPECDRLAIVCVMQCDAQAEIVDYQFQAAVIHSHARLTYKQVQQFFDGDQKAVPKKAHDTLKAHQALFKQSLLKRQARGAIDFDTQELKIKFDDQQKIESVYPVKRLNTHRLIEEAMLMTNVCVADYTLKNKLASIYRNHLPPEEEKLKNVRDFIKVFGLKLTGGVHPKAIDYSQLLSHIAKRKEFSLLQTVLLRSLRQAAYERENKGHFGLAYPAYTQFTSPIRRYPDLCVHRIIKHSLGLLDDKKSYDKETIDKLALHCSQTERRADLAVRDATDWLKCHFMEEKVGQIFSAIIVEVTSFGLFAQIDEWGIQGLVHISSLGGDYYTFQPQQYQLVARGSGKTFRLGDEVKILVAKVSLDDRTIDFDLVPD